MLAFISAAGTTVPVFVFPRKKILLDMYKAGPPGCLGLPHESGWRTGINFLKPLQHFHSYVKSTKRNPALLTLDNHSKHLDYRAVQFAKDNGIILLTFPPHCSHVLQPCDGPFKRAFEKSQNDWLQSHPGQRISIREIAQLLAGPYLLAFTPKNIVSGFKLTGICAFHSHHHL